MAYLQPQDDEEKQQEKTQTLAPGALSTGSSGMVQGGMGGALAPQQQTPQQKSGSGNFTNLKNWLDAGQGRDKIISDTGTNLLGTENKILGEKSTGALGKIESQMPLGETMTGEDYQTTFDAAAGGDQAAMSKLAGLVGQKFTGPRSSGYNPMEGDSFKHLKSVDALSATNTTGAELAGETPYSAGDRRLDNSVFGADTASQSAIGGNKKGGTDFLKSVGTTDANIAAKAAEREGQINYQRDNARNVLSAIGANITTDAETRAAKANAEAQAAFDAQAAPHSGLRNGEWVGNAPGSASMENMLDDQGYAGLSALAQLIGMPEVQRAGPYVAGHREMIDDPLNAAPAPAASWGGDATATDANNSQSLIKTGQLPYYQDDGGNWVFKESGLVIPKTALPEYLQWVGQNFPAGSGKFPTADDLKGWLKSTGNYNTSGGS